MGFLVLVVYEAWIPETKSPKLFDISVLEKALTDNGVGSTLIVKIEVPTEEPFDKVEETLPILVFLISNNCLSISSNLKILSASDLNDAAKKIVNAIK